MPRRFRTELQTAPEQPGRAFVAFCSAKRRPFTERKATLIEVAERNRHSCLEGRKSYWRILSKSCRRLMPSSWAALVRFQLVCSSAWPITRRSVSARISFSCKLWERSGRASFDVFACRVVGDKSSGKISRPATQGRSAGQHVLQLADIAGPGLRREHSTASAGQRQMRPAVFFGQACQKCSAEQRNVLAPIAQRRQPDRHHVQAIEQVLAELSRRRSGPAGRGWSPR